MRRHNVKLIFNPNADMGNAWKLASALRPIVEEFGGADWAGTVYPTHGIELATQAANEGYELIIAAGGDGTIQEVINGLMEVPKEQRPRLYAVEDGRGKITRPGVRGAVGPAVAHTDGQCGNEHNDTRTQ